MKPQNPYPKYYNDPTAPDDKSEASAHRIWQEGFDACVKWLNEPCTEHPHQVLRMKTECNEYSCGSSDYYEDEFPMHRYLCPECMKELVT